MKGKKSLNFFTVFIVILGIIAIIEVFSIIKDIMFIKKENIMLKNEISKLEFEKNKTEQHNKELKNKIIQFHQPDTSSHEIPDGWKLYRYLDYGFEVAYPENYRISTNEGKNLASHPEFEARISIHSDDPEKWIDINVISLNTYKSINDYIKNIYNYKVYIKKSIYINNKKCDLFKLSGDKHYYIFMKNKSFIFDINSSSEDFLLKIIGTFKFI